MLHTNLILYGLDSAGVTQSGLTNIEIEYISGIIIKCTSCFVYESQGKINVCPD